VYTRLSFAIMGRRGGEEAQVQQVITATCRPISTSSDRCKPWAAPTTSRP